MSFWPFGREPADIDVATRVVTATARNGFKVRGKLTLHFAAPQRRAPADEAADQCAVIAELLLREAADHEHLIGSEAEISASIQARYAASAAEVRLVELAALHVVGDATLSDELRRASTAPPPIIGGPRSIAPGSLTGGPVSVSSIPPPPSGKRRPSTQIRAVKAVMLAPGATAEAIAAFLAPMVTDASARLLVGFLRAHDLITLRGVTIDEGSAEMLATLVPASDAPLGGYEAARAGELARWQTTLGAGVLSGLHHETDAVAAYLIREAMLLVEIPPSVVVNVVEQLGSTAFGGAALLPAIARFPGAVGADFVPTVASSLTRVAGAGDEPGQIAAALAPLVGTMQEDLNVAARIVKHAVG